MCFFKSHFFRFTKFQFQFSFYILFFCLLFFLLKFYFVDVLDLLLLMLQLMRLISLCEPHSFVVRNTLKCWRQSANVQHSTGHINLKDTHTLTQTTATFNSENSLCYHVCCLWQGFSFPLTFVWLPMLLSLVAVFGLCCRRIIVMWMVEHKGMWRERHMLRLLSSTNMNER